MTPKHWSPPFTCMKTDALKYTKHVKDCPFASKVKEKQFLHMETMLA